MWWRPLAPLLAAVAVMLAPAGCARAPSDYGDETQTVFLRACTAGGAVREGNGGAGEGEEDDPGTTAGSGAADVEGADLDDLCRCSYQRISTEIPYDEFVEQEKLLELGEEPSDEIVDIVAACAGQVSETTTTTSERSTTTTTERRSTTSTTSKRSTTSTTSD